MYIWPAEDRFYCTCCDQSSVMKQMCEDSKNKISHGMVMESGELRDQQLLVSNDELLQLI